MKIKKKFARAQVKILCACVCRRRQSENMTDDNAWWRSTYQVCADIAPP